MGNDLTTNEVVEIIRDKVYYVAVDIYNAEIGDNQPPTMNFADNMYVDYSQRFRYLNGSLKKAVHRGALKLHNDLLEIGIDINVFHLENEIYGVLQCFSK